MNTRANAKKPNTDIIESEKDRIRKIFSQHIANSKEETLPEEDQNTSSSESTASFLSSNSQLVAPKPEIENNLENNTSDSDTKNSVGDLNKKRSFSKPESEASSNNSSPVSLNNKDISNMATEAKLSELCDAIKLLATQVAEGRTKSDGNNSSNGSGLGDVLGSLNEGQLDNLNLKITEREALKTHPWMSYIKLHDSKIQRIPTEPSKIEDKTIRKAIYTHIRNKKGELTDYEKMLLLLLESDPEINVSPSFLVRMINYLDEENLKGTITEAKFMLKVSEIDRAINKEELDNLRKQLIQSNYSSSSKSSKPFSSWAKENKRIDKYISWKEKYPNYKSICLDWNITGTCRRGENCGYQHKCLKCHNNGTGDCDKQVKQCENQ